MRNIWMILCLAVPCAASGQGKLSGALKIGAKVPEIVFVNELNPQGDRLDSPGVAGKLSDYRGQLVIFDFWATTCSSCIENFEHMSRLQQKYKGKIKVFLVNSTETPERIKFWINKINKRKGGSIIPGNLTILSKVGDIYRYFPPTGEIGYHVWIAPDGKHVLKGISYNTHEKKIEQLLNGHAITFVEDNVWAYNPGNPYFNGWDKTKALKYSAQFGIFDDKNANAYGTGARDVLDTMNNTKRNTYLNFSIYRLFKEAAKPFIYTDSLLKGEPIIVEEHIWNAIASYENDLAGKTTDEHIRATGYCYEQIVVSNTPDSIRRRSMLDDLNSYFKVERGITAAIESVKRTVYSIEVMDGKSLNESANKEEAYALEVLDTAKTRFAENYKGYLLSDLLKKYFAFGSLFDKYDLVISSIPYDIRVDMVLRSLPSINSLEELKYNLRVNNLDIVERIVEVPALVIKGKPDGEKIASSSAKLRQL